MLLGVDALLISAFLAGIKRSTGLTQVFMFVKICPVTDQMLLTSNTSPALARVPNKDFRQLLRSYLELGEYAFDFAVVIFGVRVGELNLSNTDEAPEVFVIREDTMKEFTINGLAHRITIRLY